MDTKILQSLKEALKGKKLIRLTHTLDEGLDQTVLDIPQEIWYKYPTLGEDFIKPQLEAKGIRCIRPFPASHRDRLYTYDHLIWKMIADGYVEKMEEEPIFFCYKNSTHLDEVSSEYGFKILMPDYKLYKEIQNKTQLQKYGVTEGKGLLPFIETSVKTTTYKDLQQQLGDKLVLQFSFSERGWNTMASYDTHIIESEKDFLELQKNLQDAPAKIAPFVEGYPICVNVINTEKGAVVSDPYLQVVGEPRLTKNNVLLSGSNFAESKNIPHNIRKQAREIAKNIGAELYKKNFKGHFGIDFIVDSKTEKVFVLEINPRFTGSTFAHTLLAHRADKIPTIAIHLAEYLQCLPESFQVEDYENTMKDIWQGGAFYVRNQEGKKVQTLKAPRPGIYKIVKDTIEFVKEEFTLKNMPREDHFLICKGFPLKRDNQKDDPWCVVISLEEVFKGDALTGKYQMVNQRLIEQFEIVPEGTYDSSIPYKVF